jgi:hypothetical protein
MAAVEPPSPISVHNIQLHDTVQNSIHISEPVETASTVDDDKNASTFTDDVGGVPSTAATSEESHEADQTASTNSNKTQV